MALVKEKYGLRGRTVGRRDGPDMHFLPFSAQTRMSGVDVNGLHIRKGAADVIIGHVEKNGNRVPQELNDAVDRIARTGGTPLVVARNDQAVGVVHLKDVVKGGIRERFAQLKRMGITHGHDHRRQPGDRCGHRGRGRGG